MDESAWSGDQERNPGVLSGEVNQASEDAVDVVENPMRVGSGVDIEMDGRVGEWVLDQLGPGLIRGAEDGIDSDVCCEVRLITDRG